MQGDERKGSQWGTEATPKIDSASRALRRGSRGEDKKETLNK